MALTQKKDGSYVASSKSDVRDALAKLVLAEEAKKMVEQEIEDKCKQETADLAECEQIIDALKAAVNAYVLNKGNYEDDSIKVTKVQGFTRKWNSDKLAKLLSKGMFLKVVDYVPNPDKINALVSQGKIDLKKIDKAYEETPKAAYPKWTPKGKSGGHDDEAASLAEKLG